MCVNTAGVLGVGKVEKVRSKFRSLPSRLDRFSETILLPKKFMEYVYKKGS